MPQCSQPRKITINILVTYYAFLVAGPVLLAVLRDSPLVSHKRSVFISYVLAPPLLLVLQTLNLSFLAGVVCVVVFLFLVNRLSRAQGDQPTTTATLWWWLVIWLIEIVIPLSLHFAFRAHADLERLSLLIAGLTLLAGTLLAFLVFACDLGKRA